MLPAGVNRGLWDYLQDDVLAADYDSSLAGSSLFQLDLQFVEEIFHQPGRLVDLGCGTGRLLLRLAGKGFWVVGIDLSEAMLKQVGKKANAAGVTVPCVKANLVELDGLADRSFDYAACLFSTLGMIQGVEERRRFLAHVHRLLRPGGRFVLHVHNRWFNMWNPQGRRWLLGDLATSWLRWREGGNRIMPVHQGIAGLTLHLFTKGEVVRLLREAGFRLLEIRPLSLAPDGQLRCPGFFPGLRSYGYLLAADLVGRAPS
jgi:SAM-dependent methyltransferase